MKVKNPSYLQSLTALLRSRIENPFDWNEGCNPWRVFAPSVTYLWTHKPQWRRRHKKRKKFKTPRFPTTTSARVKESDLSDTMRVIERPISRSSTSPYETCSSRQILTESEASKCYDKHIDREVFGLSSGHEKNQQIDRNVCVTESCSGSGLQKSREQQFIRTIRSQKRLGNARDSNFGQPAPVALNTVDVRTSTQLFDQNDLQSDCSVPKRHVTFSNYVSKNSLIDEKNLINGEINETDWWQENYERLTDDDDDDFSLQTNLSRLFSSMIFDLLSSKSSFSFDSSKNNSERRKDSSTKLKTDRSYSIFYINSRYEKESSSDLMSVKKTRSIDDQREIDESTKYEEIKDVENTKKLMENGGSHLVVRKFEKSLEIDTDMIYRGNNKLVAEKWQDIVDEERSLESEELIQNHSFFYHSSKKNHIATDTSDLTEPNSTASSPHVDNSANNRSNKVEISVIDIIDFLRRPTNQMDSILLRQLSTSDEKTFVDDGGKKRLDINGNIGKSIIEENSDPGKLEVFDLLRIDTETFGEYETISIELKDLEEDFQDEGNLKNSLRSKIEDRSVKFEPTVVHLSTIDANSNVTSSNIPSAYPVCSEGGKCCLICGRTKIDNPRYLRPVCRVAGVTPTPRLENDPWINVMKRVIKDDSRRSIVPNVEKRSRHNVSESRTESSADPKEDNNTSDCKDAINEIVSLVEEEREHFAKEEDECLNIIITETDVPTLEESNILSSKDQSTSCLPLETGFAYSSSHDYATRLRMQSAKTYYMRESVRTVNGTANRLLCVISESDSLMGLPQFLPKKPPDWFGRQVPRRKWPRR